ncbi:MAG: CCA tRNA nucleotidyltransferase [Alphaproteobacteria bacterium]|nr:CCA tRNA nucleotidyltransferase [Alphaproteobacteria bacterium]
MSVPSWIEWPQTQALIAAYKALPEALRFVGGCVRDSLLGLNVSDIDCATTLLPEHTMALLERAGIRAIPTGIAHGTITALIDGQHFEITTLRKDMACDGRHAEVAFTDDWQQDAQRRDFTMNALYMSASGELFDAVGGREDALAGRVRFIGDADDRIAEDALRILRFFRFYARFGKGAPDSAALVACVRAKKMIAGLSGERLQQEMLKLLAIPGSHTTLELMREQGVLQEILGFDITSTAPFSRLENVPAYVKLRLAVCAPDQLEALCERLRLSRDMQKTLHTLLFYCGAITSDSREQKKLIRKIGAEHFIWLAVCDAALSGGDYSPAIALARAWEPPIFPIGGHDLIAAGITPGKALGAQLSALEEAWEKSDYMLSKDALLALL